MGKKKKRLPFLPIMALLAVNAGAVLLLQCAHDAVVINYGVRAFGKLRAVLTGLSLILSAAFLVMIYRDIRKGKEDGEAPENAEEETADPLSVKKKLESDALKELLARKGEESQGWGVLSQYLMQCRQQLVIMDDYQDRLIKLLKANGEESLTHTEEVLDMVEQYICKNVRKTLNFMEVRDPREAGSMEAVKEKLIWCYEDTAQKLGQAQEFLYAVADLVNKKGDDGGDIDMVEAYKNAILDSIREE